MSLPTEQIENMTVDEKLSAIQQLWDSLLNAEEDDTFLAEEKALMNDRVAEALADPDGGRSWEEVRADLVKRT